MEVMKGIGYGVAYTLGVLASCGPSQIYGLISGVVKLIKLSVVKGQINKINDLATSVILKDNAKAKLDGLKYEYKELKEGLKQSGRCMVPIIGVIWAAHNFRPKHLTSDDVNQI